MTNRQFASNTAWLIFQQIYSGILSFTVSAIAARYLGPGNFGLIAYSASYLAFFSGITRLGLDSVIVNELIINRSASGSILGSSLMLRIIVSILSILALTALITAVEPGNKILMTITLLQSLALIFDVYEVLFYWFHAELELKYPAIGAMIASTVVCFWRIVLLIIGASVQWFAASAMIQSFVTFAAVTVIFKRRSRVRLSCSFNMMKHLLKKSYNFMISGLAVLIYLQTDKIMIGRMLGNSYVAYYTIAAVVSKLWLFIPHSLITSSQAIILKKRLIDHKAYIRSFQTLLLTVTLIGVAAGIFFQFFGDQFIKLLYGSDYLFSTDTLMVLIWASLFSGISSVRSIWIVAEGLNKFIKYLSVAGAALNIILNYFFINAFGIMGAAVATLLTEVFIAVFAPLFFKRTRVFVPLLIGSFLKIPQALFALSKRGHE